MQPLSVPPLDAHRFVAGPWWDDPSCRAQVEALRCDAARGRLRPFQLLTCTAGGPHLAEVASSFIEMLDHAGLARLTLAGRPLIRWLLVERGPCSSIDAMVDALASAGVEVSRHPASTDAGRSIADGRRAMLNAATSLDCSDAPIILLLDDDLAFDAVFSGPTGIEVGAPWPWLPALWHFHATHPHVDVALGGVTGAPPLPASSTLATNLLDLHTALRGGPTYAAAQRWSEDDHYYDLSPVRTVEQPYPLIEPLPDAAGLLDALMLHGVLARPLAATPTTLARARSAPIVRGGNTVLFDCKWVRLPHPEARHGRLRLRRADTVWAQAAVSLHGCRLGQLPWPLRHLRGVASEAGGWTEQAQRQWCVRLVADLGGVALYRGIERWRAREAWRHLDELPAARDEVLACLSERSERVTAALDGAHRRCSTMLDLRPELASVRTQIERGFEAIDALELSRHEISHMLEQLVASLRDPA